MRGCPPTPFCLRSDPKKISQKIHLPIANINANVRIKPWKYKLRPPQGSGSSVLPILWDPGTSWNQTPGPLVSMAATHARNSYMRVCIYRCIWRSRDLWAQEGTVEFCYVENFQVFSLLVGVFPPGLHVQVDIPFGAGSNQKDFADPFGLAGKVGEWLIEAFGRWIGGQHDGWAQYNKYYAFHWNYGFQWFSYELVRYNSGCCFFHTSFYQPIFRISKWYYLLPGIFFRFSFATGVSLEHSYWRLAWATVPGACAASGCGWAGTVVPRDPDGRRGVRATGAWRSVGRARLSGCCTAPARLWQDGSAVAHHHQISWPHQKMEEKTTIIWMYYFLEVRKCGITKSWRDIIYEFIWYHYSILFRSVLDWNRRYVLTAHWKTGLGANRPSGPGKIWLEIQVSTTRVNCWIAAFQLPKLIRWH